jgi:hypothetical protein
MFRCIVLLVGGLASLSPVSLFAQEAVLGQEYGSGVHAYFTGETQTAYDRLTAAIERGSQDPRAFYFRGLSYLKLGRPQEAAMDFRKGAELESKDVNRSYNVGKALERVQGPERLELENYRVNARMAALEEVERLRKARYEAVQREEERVLREQAVAAPEKPIDGGEAARSAEETSPDPFAAEATAPKKPAKAAEDGGDPFGEQAKPAKAPAPAKKSGLLGAIGKAAGSAATGKKSAPGKKPDAEKKPADDTDPFGSEPEGAKKPAPEKKPTPEKKPVKPADKKTEPADPFAPGP